MTSRESRDRYLAIHHAASWRPDDGDVIQPPQLINGGLERLSRALRRLCITTDQPNQAVTDSIVR